MFVIAGLGNPGSQYERTRHNVGFDTIEYMAALNKIAPFKIKHKALVAEGQIQGEKVMLVKPQTYMNNSGESLREILEYYKVDPMKLIVIYDDIDLDVGKLRIRPQGSAGTHNGMRSILYHLTTENFPRIRIGIGRPPVHVPLANFVLTRFTEDERKLINATIENAVSGAAAILSSTVEAAMNKYNQ